MCTQVDITMNPNFRYICNTPIKINKEDKDDQGKREKERKGKNQRMKWSGLCYVQ